MNGGSHAPCSAARSAATNMSSIVTPAAGAPRTGPDCAGRPRKSTIRTLLMAAAMTFAEAIDTIEEAYEFMLAYAAQGRRSDDDDQGAGIRERLTRAEVALGVIAAATAEAIAAGPQAAAAAGLLEVGHGDSGRARAALRLVLAQPSIGSQMVDNLNATTHVRTLLTDLFLLDETIKISGL